MVNEIASEPRRSTRPKWRLLVVALALLAALAIGGAVSLWGASQAGWISWRDLRAKPPRTAPATVADPLPEVAVVTADEQAQVALGMRIAELEQRMTRLDLQTEAAADNMSRAEGLMIALAARRAIERGLPLGFLENQLKLRFGDAQPNAVAALIEAAAHPVTREQLSDGLNALAPRLAEPTPKGGVWERIQHELAGLFVVRKESTPSPAPVRRIERAKQALASGRVDAAIAEVERLPGREAAAAWLTMARRYAVAQRSLDLIETAALLEPRRLGEGTPAPAPSPSLVPSSPSPRTGEGNI